MLSVSNKGSFIKKGVISGKCNHTSKIILNEKCRKFCSFFGFLTLTVEAKTIIHKTIIQINAYYKHWYGMLESFTKSQLQGKDDLGLGEDMDKTHIMGV